ncbi:MAG: glycosyltransferase family 39 protein [Patescibacteria group bacterium]
MFKSIKKHRDFFFLLLLVFGGLFLFAYRLNQIPPGLYVDETTCAYNAYSILKTSKDEYGKAFPVWFRLFGSYTPPLFIYSLVPLIALFGLKVWVIRLPSVLAGLAVIGLVFYFLKSISRKGSFLPYLGSLLLLICPWLVFYSRLGYEVTLAMAVFSFGVYWLYQGLSRPRFLLLGMVALSLSTYGAYTQRYLVPLFIIGFVVLFFKKIFQESNRKHFLLACLLALLIQLPQLVLIGTPAFRVKGELLYSQVISNYSVNHLGWLPYRLALIPSFVRELFSQWASYFSPRSLFSLPDADLQRSVPELSVFYDWMLIPYLVGLWTLWQARKKDWAKLVFLWLLLAPLPAALVSDPFSTQRALPIFLPLLVVISLGTEKLLLVFRRRYLRVLVFVFLMAYSLLFLWRSYFVFFPKERTLSWNWGYDQLAKIIQESPDRHFVIDQSRVKPIYIQLLFYWQYPPAKLHQILGPRVADDYYQNTEFNSSYDLANVEIRPIIWEKDIYRDQVLIGDELSISSQQAEEHFLEMLFEIKDPLDKLTFRAYQTNPDLKCQSGPTNPRCQF